MFKRLKRLFGKDEASEALVLARVHYRALTDQINAVDAYVRKEERFKMMLAESLVKEQELVKKMNEQADRALTIISDNTETMGMIVHLLELLPEEIADLVSHKKPEPKGKK